MANSSLKSYTVPTIMVVMIISSFYIVTDISLDSHKKKQQEFIVNQAGDHSNALEVKNNLVPYFDALISIVNRDDLNGFMVKIPQEDKNYWDSCISEKGCRHYNAFLIPILTNKPAYKGYDAETEKGNKIFGFKPINSYGFNGYYNVEEEDVCDHYKGIVEIVIDSGILKVNKLVCGVDV